jgi:hypothetical protein
MNNNLLEQGRLHLVKIEQLLDTAIQHEFTAESLNHLLMQVQDIISNIRNIPEETKMAELQSMDAVLENLRKARLELNVSIDEFSERGRSRRFYSSIDRCREYLEKALQAW